MRALLKPCIVRLCYHCDNKLREVEPSPPMLNIAARNTALWVIDKACSAFRQPEAHQLTLPELCWWAATKSVTDLMPENAARQVLKLPEEHDYAGSQAAEKKAFSRYAQGITNQARAISSSHSGRAGKAGAGDGNRP